MNLDELKKSMSTLDDVLAKKSGDSINFNTKTCDTAQKRIAKRYGCYIIIYVILTVIFLVAGIERVNEEIFPSSLKFFLSIVLAVSALWYAYLYTLTKKINVSADTPMIMMNKVASLRLYALIGEIVQGICYTVFFTLLLSRLWDFSPNLFWLISTALVIALIYSGIVLQKTIRDFKNLTATE